MKSSLYFGLILVLLCVAAVLYELSLEPQEAVEDTTAPAVSTTVETSEELATTTDEYAQLSTPFKVGDFTLVLAEIIEDSRCPSDVTCIQAGTVRVRGLVTTQEETFERTFVLGESLVIAGQQLTLSDVMPRTTATTSISPDEYQFRFRLGE